nr:hypothetical protein [Providencia heimbachae]
MLMCSAELYASVDTSNLQQETRTRQIGPTPSDARPYSEIKHHVHDGPVELFLIEEVTGADQSLHSVVIYDGNRYELKGEVDWLRSGEANMPSGGWAFTVFASATETYACPPKVAQSGQGSCLLFVLKSDETPLLNHEPD